MRKAYRLLNDLKHPSLAKDTRSSIQVFTRSLIEVGAWPYRAGAFIENYRETRDWFEDQATVDCLGTPSRLGAWALGGDLTKGYKRVDSVGFWLVVKKGTTPPPWLPIVPITFTERELMKLARKLGCSIQSGGKHVHIVTPQGDHIPIPRHRRDVSKKTAGKIIKALGLKDAAEAREVLFGKRKVAALGRGGS